jgi:UDP-N-acetyl-D-mannosaminuronate dehydrogenase
MKKVAIIGQGYVGLTISAFAAKSYQVVGFDNSQKVVDAAKSRYFAYRRCEECRH